MKVCCSLYFHWLYKFLKQSLRLHYSKMEQKKGHYNWVLSVASWFPVKLLSMCFILKSSDTSGCPNHCH
ncbi:hypothetical protein NC652_033296 [Populus alba x Populus x berolinensis]|nr:hypothetical protein NC652_033296 [Populus alba x Populus x berolinensis]